jgi:hypothetical protein
MARILKESIENFAADEWRLFRSDQFDSVAERVLHMAALDARNIRGMD